jgi:hypothetical protein
MVEPFGSVKAHGGTIFFSNCIGPLAGVFLISRVVMKKKLLLRPALVFYLAMGLFFPACYESGGEQGCPAIHIVSVDKNNLGPTETCGPETLPADVALATDGTVVTAQYHAQLMVCGGNVVVELEQDGNRLEITERVEDIQGVCGCYNKLIITVAVDVCAPGSYALVIGGVEHPVTI